MTYILKDKNRGKEREFEDEKEAQQERSDLIGVGADPSDLEIINDTPLVESDGGEAEPVEAEPIEPADLSKDPIGFLRSVNSDFVNIIRGTPAISKKGFRFIQREFEITTESEVVQWSEDPLGCVVWAKAELPSGYSAEAHGEGYQFESGVSDNEFVRYADTRAKNRAISDLTSAGALAVSELQQ